MNPREELGLNKIWILKYKIFFGSFNLAYSFGFSFAPELAEFYLELIDYCCSERNIAA